MHPLLSRWRSTGTSLAVLGAGLAFYLYSILGRNLPWVANSRYGGGPGQVVRQRVSVLTGTFDFPLADALLVFYLLWLVALLLLAARRLAARRLAWRAAAAGGGLRVARHAGALLIATYALWGMNYARPTFAVQAGWPEQDGHSALEVATLLQQAAFESNAAYLAIHGVEDAGEPTRIENLRALEAAVDEGWRRTADLFGLPPSAYASYGRVKWRPGRPLFNRAYGSYNPFTGEVKMHDALPGLRVAQTMAHEKAHQRGVARESDANFLGFIAASHAPHPHARYAAAIFAYRQLLFLAFDELTLDELRPILQLSSRGVRRDILHFHSYTPGAIGPIADFTSSLGSSLLSLSGTPGGALDYQRSVFLIIAWSRMNDGRLMPPAEALPGGARHSPGQW
jgi:hypothetical protein